MVSLMKINSISSTVLINVNGGFLNGMGSIKLSQGDITKVKQFVHDGEYYAYLSAQAYKKMLRDTINHDIGEFGYYDRLYQKKYTKSEFKNLGGKWVDPVVFFEDDVFGYSHPLFNQPEQSDQLRYNVVSINRTSPLLATNFVSMMKNKINIENGFLHLRDDTPLPYTTEFTSDYFTGSVILNLNRVGIFKNYGDTYEIDPDIASYHLKNKALEIVQDDPDMQVYQLINRENRLKETVKTYFDSLLNLNGGAKQSQFAVDLTPRIIITVGQKGADNPFRSILSSKNGIIFIDTDKLTSIILERGHTFSSDVYIGYRKGTFTSIMEKILYNCDGKEIFPTRSPDKSVKIHVVSPGEIKDRLLNLIEKGGN